MGGAVAARLSAPRSRWRAYLLLARVSNLPTVWTNVLAGMAATHAPLDLSIYVPVTIAASLFYSAGMFLNDAWDAELDAGARPERPIPSGDVAQREVYAIGTGLLAAGGAALLPFWPAPLAGLALAGAIVLYTWLHKRTRWAAVVMGACRALVYIMAAAAAAAWSPLAFIGAALVGVYVAGLTIVARFAGPNARWLVPLLIAGISLLDAVVVLIGSGSVPLSLVTASGFALTLGLQKWVPGD